MQAMFQHHVADTARRLCDIIYHAGEVIGRFDWLDDLSEPFALKLDQRVEQFMYDPPCVVWSSRPFRKRKFEVEATCERAEGE